MTYCTRAGKPLPKVAIEGAIQVVDSHTVKLMLPRADITLTAGMAEGQKMIQDEGVTIQPYWRSPFNHTKEDLVGGAHHIGFEIRPAELAWT